tara:strand:+ start:45 stop:1943 length:1899 start_codon:yes stop_codon:yes gene_type:complete
MDTCEKTIVKFEDNRSIEIKGHKTMNCLQSHQYTYNYNGVTNVYDGRKYIYEKEDTCTFRVTPVPDNIGMYSLQHWPFNITLYQTWKKLSGVSPGLIEWISPELQNEGGDSFHAFLSNFDKNKNIDGYWHIYTQQLIDRDKRTSYTLWYKNQYSGTDIRELNPNNWVDRIGNQNTIYIWTAVQDPSVPDPVIPIYNPINLNDAISLGNDVADSKLGMWVCKLKHSITIQKPLPDIRVGFITLDGSGYTINVAIPNFVTISNSESDLGSITLRNITIQGYGSTKPIITNSNTRSSDTNTVAPLVITGSTTLINIAINFSDILKLYHYAIFLDKLHKVDVNRDAIKVYLYNVDISINHFECGIDARYEGVPLSLDICGGNGIFSNGYAGICIKLEEPMYQRLQQVKMVNTNYTFNNYINSGILNVGGDLSILDTALNFSNNLIGIYMKEQDDPGYSKRPEPTLTITNSTCTFSGSSDIEKSNNDIGIDASNSIIKIQDSTSMFTYLYSSLRSISSDIYITRSQITSSYVYKPFDMTNSLLELSSSSKAPSVIVCNNITDGSNYGITLTDKSILQSNGIPDFNFDYGLSISFDQSSKVYNPPIQYRGLELKDRFGKFTTNRPYDFSLVYADIKGY